MGARASLWLQSGNGTTLTAPALFNGGFESRRPCVLLPVAAAKILFPQFPQRTRKETILTAGGSYEVRTSIDALEARIVTRDRKGSIARLEAMISAAETEVVISDTAIDALRVEIKSPGRGLWRYAGERRIRRSISRRDW